MSTDNLLPTAQHPLEQRARVWLEPPFDSQTQAQVRHWIEQDRGELQEAFWKELEFGTGGMRGLMGIGDSRMNRYTVQRATQGLCNWLVAGGAQERDRAPCAVVAYDSRHHSKEFAHDAARVLAANGFEVFLFAHLRPTPMLSFAVRYLQACCGIMITASHNPPQYNGFKVYDSEGCQFYLPQDLQIAEAVKATSYQQIRESSLHDQRIHLVDSSLDQPFLDALRKQQRCSDLCARSGSELRLIYSSLHGTGITLAPLALAEWGFRETICVDAQSQPSGDFPTVTAPNPEDPSALELGIQQLLARQGDLLIANDPDADRIGVAVRHEGLARVLSGQEIALLLADHLIEHSCLEPKPMIIKSLVTSPLMARIAKEKGVLCYDVLPGFKYIGRLVRNTQTPFLFGAEESHGYLAGLHARDKDGIVAACLVAEAALVCKSRGITLIERLEQLYQLYGREGYRLITISEQETQQGREKLDALVEQLRSSPPPQIGPWPVIERLDLSTQAHEPLVAANLILWKLPHAQVVIRPSGTEPKVKIYLSVNSSDEATLHSQLQELESYLRALIH